MVNETRTRASVKTNLKSKYNIEKSVQHLWIIAISNPDLRNFIVNWLSDIWVWALVLGSDDYKFENISSVEKIDSNSYIWFDFFVYDNDFDWIDVIKFMSAWIVPIMPFENTFTWILKDFNPMKFEWNWFFWKKDSNFCVFEKIISFFENIKFPEDRRVLIKNVTTTF